MDNIKICKKISKQIKKDLSDIVDIGIEIQTHTATSKGQDNETTTYTGKITSTTKTQIYTGNFTAKTHYEPLFKTKWFTTNGIYTEQLKLQINYDMVKPR
jgi:hypothetical protein